MSFGGGSGSGSIAGSTDVVLNTPANNEVLGYNAGTAKWQNQAKTTGPCFTCDPRALKATATTFPAANRTYYMRVQGEVSGATAYRVWVGTASGNISIANYANIGTGINAAPTGAPRGVTGSVACPATGAQLVFASGGAFNIAEGDWIGLSCNNATAAFGTGADGAPTALYAGVCSANNAFPAGTPSAPYVATTPFFVAAEFATAGGTAPSFTAAAPPAATANTAYSYTFTASGSPAPTFAVTAGGIPTGTTLSSGGLLSGTPTVPETANFTVTASNGVAPNDSVSRNIVIAAAGGGGGATPAWLGDYQTTLLTGYVPNTDQFVRQAQQVQITAASAGIPARAGYPYVGRFIVAPGDYTNGGTQQERSEVYCTQGDSGFPVNGQTMWWAWSMYLPSGFNVDSDAASPVGNGWINLTQWHCESGSGGGGLGVSFALTKGTSTPRLVIGATSSEWIDSQPLPLGVWNDFAIGITWGDGFGATGHILFKLNGRTVVDANANTLQVGQWAYFKQGCYRSASNQTHTIYYTGTRRGITEASVAL